MPAQALEKYGRNDTTVRLKRLGQHKIEVVMSDRKKELQEILRRTVTNTSYTSETERTKRGNLVCRLLPNAKMSFNQLIQKVVNLIVRSIERYEKKHKKETTFAQSRAVHRAQKSAKRYPNYRMQKTTVAVTT